jgi:hypothetical protein
MDAQLAQGPARLMPGKGGYFVIGTIDRKSRYEGDPGRPPVERGALVRQTDSYECDRFFHQWDENAFFGGLIRHLAPADAPGPAQPLAAV